VYYDLLYRILIGAFCWFLKNMEHGVNVNSGTTLGASSDSSYNNSALPPENTSRQHSRVCHALNQLCFACCWLLAIARVAF
jgi:hypothetical protein